VTSEASEGRSRAYLSAEALLPWTESLFGATRTIGGGEEGLIERVREPELLEAVFGSPKMSAGLG
jgi:hypothetical protein